MRYQWLPVIRKLTWLILVKRRTNTSVRPKLITVDETAKVCTVISYGRYSEPSLWYWEKGHQHHLLYDVEGASHIAAQAGINCRRLLTTHSWHYHRYSLSRVPESAFALRLWYPLTVTQKTDTTMRVRRYILWNLHISSEVQMSFPNKTKGH